MKFLVLMSILMVSSCTHYSVTKLTKDEIVLSKTTQFLSFWGGTVSHCFLDEGKVKSCNELNVDTPTKDTSVSSERRGSDFYKKDWNKDE